MKFKTIVIDPPWQGPAASPTFKKSKEGKSSIVLMPYTTMGGVELSSMRIQDISLPESTLFIWATSRSLADAYMLMSLWSYTYRGLFVWKKPLGMGRHMRHELEFIVYGGRRGAKLVQPKKCPRQVYEWPKPRRHSEKPPEAYEMIRQISDAPRIDIFARQSRPGFVPWGNEAPAP